MAETPVKGADELAPAVAVKSRDPLSNEARKQVSREATKAAVARELMEASIITRMISAYKLEQYGWGAYLFKPSKPQAHIQWMLCIETPGGPLCWRIWRDKEDPDATEMALVEHIKDRREHGPKNYEAGDKLALLLLLSTEGWIK